MVDISNISVLISTTGNMIILKKTHEEKLAREQVFRAEIAQLVIRIYQIAMEWKNGKIGNLKAISSIYGTLDINKENIFRYRYEDPVQPEGEANKLISILKDAHKKAYKDDTTN